MARRATVVRGWLAWPVVAAITLLAPVPPGAVEAYYSWGVYPRLQQVTTLFSNLLPIALLDVFIAAACLLVVVRIVLLARTLRRDGIVAAVWEGVRRTLRASAILVVVFMCMWGWNYRRVPLEAAVARTSGPSTAELTEAIRDANALAARLRLRLGDDRDITYAEVSQRLATPMHVALEALGRDDRLRPGRPKYSLLLTPFFTWSGVSGMLNPYALESIVHPDLLPVERGFVLAHEWAHLAGHADEAEASAVGWYACMRGGPVLAYSASLYLILEAGGALPAEARARAFASLDEGVKTDLQQIAERLQLQKPQVQRATMRVYDEYLKANRVADGTASYSRALTLILSEPLRNALDDYREPGVIP